MEGFLATCVSCLVEFDEDDVDANGNPFIAYFEEFDGCLCMRCAEEEFSQKMQDAAEAAALEVEND